MHNNDANVAALSPRETERSLAEHGSVSPLFFLEAVDIDYTEQLSTAYPEAAVAPAEHWDPMMGDSSPRPLHGTLHPADDPGNSSQQEGVVTLDDKPAEGINAEQAQEGGQLLPAHATPQLQAAGEAKVPPPRRVPRHVPVAKPLPNPMQHRQTPDVWPPPSQEDPVSTLYCRLQVRSHLLTCLHRQSLWGIPAPAMRAGLA